MSEEHGRTAGLYTYATLVSRRTEAQFVTSIVHGYHYANSEDEARGMGVAHTIATKPEFSIDQVLVMRISDDAVRHAAAALALPTPEVPGESER